MASAGPWSVKGIDEETRGLAREAALRAGLPIGVWIDHAILKAAGQGATAAEAGAFEPAAATALPDLLAPGTTPHVDPTLPAAESAEFAAIPPPPPDPSSRHEDEPAPVPHAAPPGARVPAHVPAVRAGRAHGRHETLAYALAGVAVLLAVVIGANFVDRVALPSDREGQQTVAAVEAAGQAAQPDEAAQPERQETVAAATPPASETPEPVSRLERLQRLAGDGDAAAQHELALLYAAGVDVAKDESRAAEWFGKAAAQGFAPSQYNLGVVYEQGLGIERDAQAAFTWYRSAAEQGYGRAQHNLATLYAMGNGTAQNYEEAARWFARAVESGVPESLYSLGLMHEHGLGLAQDDAKARSYYQRAMDAGVAEAARKLAALPKEAEILSAAAQAAADVAPAAGTAAPREAPDRPLDQQETAELQRLLQRLDFAPGSADGVVGRQTTAAIKLYQEFAGLRVDGKATHRLLEEIRQISGSLGRRPRAASR